MTPEQQQVIFDLIMSGAWQGTSSGTTATNRMENIFDLLYGGDASVLTGTSWPQYTAPTPFPTEQFMPITMDYIASGDPVWSQVAQGLYTGEYTRISAMNYLIQQMADNTNIDRDTIQREVDLMQQEIADAKAKEFEWNEDQRRQLESNEYGSRGLPQPWEEYGMGVDALGRPQTPPPMSQTSAFSLGNAQNFADEYQRGGYDELDAKKKEALALKIGAMMKELVSEQDKEKEGEPVSAKDNKYEATASYDTQYGFDQYGRFQRPGLRINFEPAKTPEKKFVERDVAANYEDALPFEKLIMTGMMRSSPVYGKAKSEVDQLYSKREAEARSLRIRQAESERLGAIFREMDAMRAQRAGRTPLSDAMTERVQSVLLPYLQSYGKSK